MTAWAYYNDNDEFAAARLRNLIDAGHIAPGEVDSRSIRDVRPDDLRGFSQCHFFAGIGGWSLAARLAGWSDDRPLWSASCPCQPFSAAGKRQGTADPRHLWPVFWPLARAHRPPVIVGEQVAGKDGLAWLDGVLDDLEGSDYTGRAVIVPAGAIGAPHRRERLWWLATLADADGDGRKTGRGSVSPARYGNSADASGRECGCLADPDTSERRAIAPAWHDDDGAHPRRAQGASDARERSVRDVGDPDPFVSREGGAPDGGRNKGSREEPRSGFKGTSSARLVGDPARLQRAERFGFGGDAREEFPPFARTGGSFWADAERIDCADGKRRRVKPGVPLLADGVPRDVAGMLAGFGNAIVPQVAAEVLGAWLDCCP